MTKTEVFTSVGRRRRWSAAEKERLPLASFPQVPGRYDRINRQRARGSFVAHFVTRRVGRGKFVTNFVTRRLG